MRAGDANEAAQMLDLLLEFFCRRRALDTPAIMTATVGAV
jgi:hypothetical protein